MIQHKWYKGEQQQYGNYVYRDDVCDCGATRRMTLNDEDKQVIESYTVKEHATVNEPPCPRKAYKKKNKARK